MAERPQQHILETESKKAFDSVIPSEWVIRSHEPDYGIDREIQIFENGNITPYFFFVQLKATNSIKNVSQTPTFSFSTKRLLEYFDYPLPVLLVLYDANHKRLFYKWSHFLSDELEDEKQKLYIQETLTVGFENELDSNNSNELFEDVKNYFFAAELSPENTHDITVNVVLNVDENLEVRIIDELKKWLWITPSTRFIRIGQFQQPDILIEGITDWQAITVSTSYQKIAFPFIEIDDMKDANLVTALSSSLKVILARVLAFTGRLNAALDIIANFLIEDCFITSSIEYQLSRGFWTSLFILKKRTFEAIEIAEKLLENGHINLATLFAMSLNFNNLNQSIGANKYQSFLRKSLKLAKDNSIKGVQSYNLANNLRDHNFFREAVGYYFDAARFESSYKSKAYWWAELGGCLFHLNKLKWAENCYRKAIELKEDRLPVRGLLADTLLYQGRFEEAAKNFGIYLEETEYPNSEAVLKKWLSDDFTDRFGAIIKRKYSESEEITLEAIKIEDIETQGEMFEKAIITDPLSGLAWQNYAIYQNLKLGENNLEIWLISAIISNDAYSWTNTIFLLFDELSKTEKEFNSFHAAIINEAWNLNNEIEEVVKTRLSGANSEFLNWFMPEFQKVAEEAKWLFSQELPMLIRA